MNKMTQSKTFCILSIGYGRNELDILMENDWENSRILNIMDQSIEPDEMKPKPYGTVLKLEQYEEDIYDDDDSENSNID